ncbi:MAG TPA: S46 family peptidase [Parasegetibacter sp.]
MKRFLQTTLLLIAFVFTHLISRATEGMWLPQLLQALNEKEMKAMGMKISASDIYNINKSSLKDAIVSFGGFCTAEVISEQGLLLTNHHCGYSAIQSHSSVEHNYLQNGFWAMTKQQELPNAGLTATFIISITDVTKEILKGVTDEMTASERQALITGNTNALSASFKKEEWQNILIRPFFEGNQYFAFVTETYKDVRLVGAPPSSIGKFGSDTDNWVWPRHTGDFAIFRIYADKNNRPAEYSADNVPYKPKKALTISLDGIKKGDFTMVFGFPGRTQEYLHSGAVNQTLNSLNPARNDIRTKALNIIDKYMRSEEAIKIQYASKFASTANAWKKWIGESMGLKKTDALGKKQRYEAEFAKRISAKPELKAKYGTLLDELANAYKEFEAPALYREIFNETVRNIELLNFSSRVINFINNARKNPGDYAKLKNELIASSADFYKNYEVKVDREVAAALLEYFAEKMPADFIPSDMKRYLNDRDNNFTSFAEFLYSNSALASPTALADVLDLPSNEAINKLISDPGVQLMSQMGTLYSQKNSARVNELQDKINTLQTKYMTAQMAAFPEKRFYPDANGTMRVTYGKVDGYTPKDGVSYDFITYLDGVMEKYVPGDYEFDVPEKLIELYKTKDYGRYGVNGKMPVCFIASNHTTGGNSGSPALDANGNLIGLNFDRCWEGTMSDINYDPSICRNIMVDVRYILFIIDKFAGAGHLISEMKLAGGKKF